MSGYCFLNDRYRCIAVVEGFRHPKKKGPSEGPFQWSMR